MDTEVRAPASWPARLSLWLADVVAVVAVLSVLLRLLAAAGVDALGSEPGAVPLMALTACALAGVVLGGAWAIRTRAPGAHWGALLIVAGPLLVAAVSPLLAGIPAAGLALLLRRGVRGRLA